MPVSPASTPRPVSAIDSRSTRSTRGPGGLKPRGTAGSVLALMDRSSQPWTPSQPSTLPTVAWLSTSSTYLPTGILQSCGSKG